MSTLINDIKYTFRRLISNPCFTGVAVISLALGIGASTAVFSLVNAILLRSLPVPNPHELRVLRWSGTEEKINFTGALYDNGANRATGDAVSYPLFSSLRQNCSSLGDIFGYKPLVDTTAKARREAFVAHGAIVSDNFFSALGVQPLLGRLLSNEDNEAGAVPVVVIIQSWWEWYFDRDPDVLGRTILLNGYSFTIAGVLPREFTGVKPGDEMEFYVPMSAQPQLAPGWPTTSTDNWWVQLMARLKPGISDTQFRSALDVVFTRETSSIMRDPKVLVEDGRGGREFDRNYYRRPLLILLSVVGMVILVACANLAGLSLARSASRQHEFAVRASLGAGCGRLARQILTESLLLALSGGILGVMLALWGKNVLSHLLAGSAQGLHYDTSLDLTVLSFSFAITLVTALLSGLLPALRAARIDSLAVLKERSTLAAPHLRAGRILVVGQIALSLLLLAGAGLFFRTLVNLVRINPGFAMENLLLFQVNPHNAGYRGARTAVFYNDVQRSLAVISGVRSVTLTQYPLLGCVMSGGGFFTLPGHSFEVRPRAHRLTVSETFFATMGIPVLLGRELRAADTEGAPKVVVVNETFAQKYLPGESPIGQTLRADSVDWQIVGLCRDAKYTDIKADVPPTVYFSFRQNSIGTAFFALRTSLPPLAEATAARKAVAAIDSDVPLSNISTQEQVRDKKINQERMFATLCGALAFLALLLSCIGLYGIMAFNVTRRTGEIGIRISLGATPSNVAWTIFRGALLMTMAGIGIGLPAVLATVKLIHSYLYGIEPYDMSTLTGAAAILFIVTLTAAWIPARRAARIDPMEALRYE
jgi:predicted permease